MNAKSIFILFLWTANSLFAQNYLSGEALLKAMHKKYDHGPCPCYTFSQKNTHYKKDSIVSTSEWHEKIRFPDYFRIDFGDTTKRNFIVYKNDSVYSYKNSQLNRSRSDSSSLLLILGGMYYRNFEEVKARLLSAGFDLSKITTRHWFKKDVWVIGINDADDLNNQIWISKEDFRVLRIIEKINAEDTMDMRFESHEKWCKGWVETTVSFRRNGELEQVEEYYNIRACSDR